MTRRRFKLFCAGCQPSVALGRITRIKEVGPILYVFSGVGATVQDGGAAEWRIICEHGHVTRWHGAVVIWKKLQTEEAA